VYIYFWSLGACNETSERPRFPSCCLYEGLFTLKQYWRNPFTYIQRGRKTYKISASIICWFIFGSTFKTSADNAATHFNRGYLWIFSKLNLRYTNTLLKALSTLKCIYILGDIVYSTYLLAYTSSRKSFNTLFKNILFTLRCIHIFGDFVYRTDPAASTISRNSFNMLLKNILSLHSEVCVCVCVYIYICICICIYIYYFPGNLVYRKDLLASISSWN
jgi:hypothetical protein